MGENTDSPCRDCGACCAEMNSPPFMPEHFDGTELNALPVDVREDFLDGMRARNRDDWPDNVPCFWLTDDLRCKHYNHRPEICREFEVGSEACQGWRERFNIV